MIALFVWLSTFVFGGLSVIWSKDDWFNFLLKLVFFSLMVTGVSILIKENGFSGVPLS